MTGSIVSLFFIGLVAGAFAGSDNPLAVEIADGVTIEPTYDPDTGAVGISITIEFKRAARQPKKEGAFSLLDWNGDGLLTVEEWHTEGGSVVNFAEFLKSKDKNGDEDISWEEFQTVTGVYTKK